MRPRFLGLLGLEFVFLLRQKVTWAVLLPLTLALIGATLLGAERVKSDHALIEQAHGEELRVERDARVAAEKYSRPSALKIDFYRDPTGPYSYLTQFLVRSPAKALSPLGALAIGQSDVAPSRMRLTFGFSAIFTDDFADIGSPRLLKRGGFDPAFVLVYLLPLAIIALAVTRLASEQDTGLLRMIAAQPIGMRTVAATKFGAVAGLFLVWLALAGSAALAVGGMVPLPAGWGGTLAWLVVLLALYVLFWVTLCALAVSLWRGAAAAIATAVAAWALLAILLPSAGALYIDLVAPAPSRIAYIDTSRKATAQFYEQGDDIARAWAKGVPELSDRPDLATTTEVKRFARDDFYKRVLHPHRRELDGRRNRAAALADRFALLSPVLAVQRALERGSGTDALRQVRFQAEVDRFDDRVRAHFRPLILDDVLHRKRACPGCAAQLSFAAFDRVPRFPPMAGYTDPGRAAREGSALLLALTLAIGLLCARRFREGNILV